MPKDEERYRKYLVALCKEIAEDSESEDDDLVGEDDDL